MVDDYFHHEMAQLRIWGIPSFQTKVIIPNQLDVRNLDPNLDFWMISG
jgi:hypothetical protein